MGDLVLQYITALIPSVLVSIPVQVIILMSFRAARMRGLTPANYRERVDESLSDTLKEQINKTYVRPLLEEHGVHLPRGTQSCDLVERLAPDGPGALETLNNIFASFNALGAESPFFHQILEMIQNLPPG